MRIYLAAAVLLAACAPAVTQTQGRETPSEIRRIVSQAICLAEAYPSSAVAADSAAVIATYQGSLGAGITAQEITAVRALAKAAQPGTPTPVGNRNFGIARCVLFAERADVHKLLGGPAGRP